MPDPWDARAAAFDKRPLTTTLLWSLGIIGVIVVLLVVVSYITTGAAFFNAAQAKITVKPRVTQRAYSTDNATAQISFFHDTCNTAASQVKIVRNNEARLAADEKAAHFSTDPITKQQAITNLSSDQQDVTGAENALQATASAYNSRAKTSTAAMFRENGLPEQINIPSPIPSDFTINCG